MMGSTKYTTFVARAEPRKTYKQTVGFSPITDGTSRLVSNRYR